jgi:hypothetical protein
MVSPWYVRALSAVFQATPLTREFEVFSAEMCGS